MSMFRFAHQEYLYLLYLLPILIIVGIGMVYRKKKILSGIAASESRARMFLEKCYAKDYFKFSLIIISLALLILAFANPQIGTRIEDVKLTGIDAMVCLDVSLSMKAEDLKPNRLDLAKREIAQLLKNLKGDRVGLIVFAGSAYVQFPLTSDYSAANLFLNTADVNSVPEQGTALAAAINLSVKSFDNSSPTRKVIIVITDGEDHEGDLEQAITEAKSKNVAIYSIGMASPNGAPIPVYDGQGNQVDFKKDRNGSIILTKLDEGSLKQMADKTSGKYYLASPAGDELRSIYQDLGNIQKTEFGTKQVTDYDDKYYYFLIPALLFLLVEFFISDKRSARFRNLLIKLKLKEE